MIKSLGMKTAVLALVIVFSSGAVYASPRLTFRLLLEDVNSGERIVITDGAAGLDENTNDGVIAFNQNVGTHGYVQGTVAYSEPDGGDGAILTLQSVVTNTGAGDIKIILEDLYSSSKQNGTFISTLSGLDSEDVPGTLDPFGFVQRATANFATYVNTDGGLPILPGDGASTFVPSGLDDGISIPGGAAVFLAGPFTSTSSAQTPVQGSGVSTFDFTGSAYSIYSVVTVHSTASNPKAGQAQFTLVGEVKTSGNPLVSGNVPEPTSLLLLGSGLVGLALVRRKKGMAV